MLQVDSKGSVDGNEIKNFDQSHSSCSIGHKHSHDWTGAILKTVIVNGTMKVLGQIDHGSSDCLIQDSVAKYGGWYAEPGNPTGAIIINSIGGTMYPTKLIYVHLTIDGVRAEVVPLLVVPDDALPYPLMVGRSWMEQRCIGYVRDENELRFFYLTKLQESIQKSIVPNRVFQTRNVKFSEVTMKTSHGDKVLDHSADLLNHDQGRSDDRVQGKEDDFKTSEKK